MSQDDVLAGLNPEQYQTAVCDRHCLTIACPGSGKTKTLAAKAAFFLQQGERVAAVTFTRDSAIELRNRIVAAAGPAHKDRLLVGTFHSIDLLMAFPDRRGEYGADILRDMRSPYAKTQGWKVVNEGLRYGYVLRAMTEAGITQMKYEEASRIIEVGKASGCAGLEDPSHAAMVEVYSKLLARSGQIDFQDIILKTNVALASGEMTPMKLGHLMIDEFQDTDVAQYAWAAMHAKANVTTTAVGDDDQSIYAFRRALGYQGLEQFAQDFNAQRITLGMNYRCHAEILDKAKVLITTNIDRYAKPLQAHKGAGGTVEWKSYKNREAEAEAAADAAATAYSEGRSFAVISRTNRRLDDIETALTSLGTPFKRADGKSIFDYPEVQVYLALIRSLSKPQSKDVDLVLFWAGLSEADLSEIHELFGESIRIGAKQDYVASKISAAGLDIWKSFAAKHIQWSKARKDKLMVTVRDGVLEWLTERATKPSQKENLGRAHALLYPKEYPGEPRLKEVMAMERSRHEKAKDANAIALITAHGSKGLEYDRVWIIGAETGVFPAEDSGLEEERRLMFVAMTRARETLWFSSTEEKLPSLFLKECGLHG